MKKFITLSFMAMIAMTSSLFVSCGGDDDDNTTQKVEEVVKSPIDLQFVVCNAWNQSDYFDMTYTISIKSGSTTSEKTIKISEMTEVKDTTTLSNCDLYRNAVSLAKAFKYYNKSGWVKVFTYDLGKITGGTYTISNITYAVKSGHPTGQGDVVDVLEASGFYSPNYSAWNYVIDTQIYGGIPDDDNTLQDLANTNFRSDSKFSY